MIRMSVLYPGGAGKRFDLEYYTKTHMDLVKRRWTGMGLVKVEVDKGLGGGTPGSPAPYVAVGHVYFQTMDDLQKAVRGHGQELFADVPNFTDIAPQVQISEIVG